MMGSQAAMLLVAGLLCACGGAPDTHEEVAEAMIDEMGNLADILEGIKSKDDADDAADDLEALAGRMAELTRIMQKLGNADTETEKEIMEKYNFDMMKVSQRIGKAGQTAGPYIAESEKCQKAFERVGQKMSTGNE